jgi:hypothetical protein
MWGYNEDKDLPNPSSTIYKSKHKSMNKLPALK